MNLRIPVFLLCLSLLSLNQLQASRFFVSKWLQTFHETQDVADFEKALLVWKARESLEDANGRQPIIGFLSHLFAAYPETILLACNAPESEPLSEGAKATFASALLRVGTESRKRTSRIWATVPG